MSESAAKHRRWPKWATLLLILAVLVLLGFFFWERLAVFMCMHLLRRSPRGNSTLDHYGQAGLKWLGPRAVPYLVSYLEARDDTRGTYVQTQRFLAAASIVVHNWSDLTPEQVQAVSPHIFYVTLNAREVYQAGRPVSFTLCVTPCVAPAQWWRTWPNWVQTVELLEERESVVSFRLGQRATRRVPGEWTMVFDGRMPWVGTVPGALEMARRLQEPGEHTIRVSVAVMNQRLAGPVPIGQVTRTVHTVESLPPGYFVARSDPVTNDQMKGSLRLDARLDGDMICFALTKVKEPLTVFVGRVVFRIRETGEEIATAYSETILPGWYVASAPPAVPLSELRLEPGRTYHLQVVLKPDPEVAWLDPRITEYWDGELESNWVEVTVP